MVYTLTKLPDEPIIIDIHREPIDAFKDFAGFAQDLAQLALSIEGPIYRVIDLTGLNLSFSELQSVMSEEARSGRPGSTGDPRVTAVMVAEGLIGKLVAQASKKVQYGSKEVKGFPTQEEALAHVRKLIAARTEGA